MISALSVATAEDRTSRRIVLWSLALNLFFIGLVAALLVRLYVVPPAAPAPVDRSANGRIERIAATLPAADAEVIRAEYRAKAAPVDAARDEFERADRRDAANLPRRALRYRGDARGHGGSARRAAKVRAFAA